MRPAPSSTPMLLATTAAALAPHAPRLPAWVLIWCLAAAGWSLLLWYRKTPWPARWVLNLLAAAGFAGCLGTYGLAFNRTAGVAILAAMLALKPLEARTYRDRMISAFLIFFLILSNLLFSNSLSMFFYMLGSVMLTTMLLIRIQDPEERPERHGLLAARTVLLALPVMALFFFLFPRIPGGFLRLPDSSAAQTGFAMELSPGSVTRLAQSRAVAFRASFEQGKISPEQRYWRGLVFTEFDGRTWRPDPAPRPGATNPAAPGPAAVSQQIELEPHRQQWLFALDLPVAVSTDATLLADHTLQAPEKIERRIRYTAFSAVQRRRSLPAEAAPPPARLPPQGNPGARKLSARWQKDSRSPAGVVDHALAFFRDGAFVYSLNPPALGQDPIDDFLFGSKRGFCEHYASAFAFLMRAAGIPSRIVGGYLGGEHNPYGGYLIVRQADAHAWVEVWLANRGWVRVDPTRVVAPERSQGGAEAALPPEERISRTPLADIPYIGGAARRLFLGWDAVNTFWSRSVMGYSAGAQRRLLERLGLPADSWKGPAAAFCAALLLVAAGGAVFVLVPRSLAGSRKDPVQRAYLRLCAKLARAGIAREPSQGPLDFLAAVERRRPDLAPRVRPAIERYVRLRYGPGRRPEDVARFVKEVRRMVLENDAAGRSS